MYTKRRVEETQGIQVDVYITHTHMVFVPNLLYVDARIHPAVERETDKILS